jgi:hypothetical protein
MTTSNQPPAGNLGRAGAVTAIGLLVAFLAALVVLGVMRGDKDWDRLIYLLSGLEAVVFAGAGALFGTTVQRAQVVEAKQEAVTERQRADSNESEAMAGRALHRGVVEKEAQQQGAAAAASAGPPGARAGRPTAGGGAPSDVAELAQLARSLFPDR